MIPYIFRTSRIPYPAVEKEQPHLPVASPLERCGQHLPSFGGALAASGTLLGRQDLALTAVAAPKHTLAEPRCPVPFLVAKEPHLRSEEGIFVG